MKKILAVLASAALAASMGVSAFAADAVLGAPIDRKTDTGVGLTFADPNNANNDSGAGGLDPAKLAAAHTVTVESTCGSEQNFFFVIKTDGNGWQQKEFPLVDGKAVLPIGEWVADEDLEDVEHTFFVFIGNWDGEHEVNAANTTVTVQMEAAGGAATAEKANPGTGDRSGLPFAGLLAIGAIAFVVLRIKR